MPRVNLRQPAACDEDAIGVDHGQLMPRRKGDDEFAVNQRRPTHHHDQAAIRRARECRDGAFDLAGVGQSNRPQLDVQRVCHGSLSRRGDGRALHDLAGVLSQSPTREQPHPARLRAGRRAVRHSIAKMDGTR